PGATGAVFTLSAVTTNDNASYRVVASNLAGSVTSQAATLTVTVPTPVYVAPAFTRQPANVTVDAGGIATFTAAAVGTPAPSYQWEKNGVTLPGATGAVLTLSAVTTNDNASYRVVASNLAGTVWSQAATLTVVSATSSSGSQSQPPLLFVKLTVAFSDQMEMTSLNVPGDSPRRVLIRALGPTFAAIGGTNVLNDPKIDVYQSSSQAFSNDNWGGGAELTRVSSQVGAVPFLSPDSRDAALIVTLEPGFALILISGMDGSIGNVLVEAYLVP
ncbi:MAG: immunoglobulin domain-containing protein, partial [Rhodoglobus sp.]|nr:immunoglobulin domain-containing protein [Rhodoglobus sp.]